MTSNSTQKLPTTSVAEARLRIFQPTQRPTRVVEKEILTRWGEVKITGRLGQRHLDLLQLIRVCAFQGVVMENGSLRVLVDPYEIRKRLGGEGIYSHQGMWTLLNETIDARVEGKAPRVCSSGHIINDATEAKTTRRNPLTGKERALLRVDFGPVATTFFNADFLLYYDPTPISALQYGISQAIARLVLTHKDEPNGGWKIDTLIHQVAGDDINPVSMAKHRGSIKADARGLEACGSGIAVEAEAEAWRIRLRAGSIPQPPDGTI